MVEERGADLRRRPFAELEQLTDPPSEQITVGSRSATIGIIVLCLPSGGVQVVVQGFLRNRFLPGSSVALDGFYKYADETISPMKDEEFYQFD
jgi:hypothetical protein